MIPSLLIALSAVVLVLAGILGSGTLALVSSGVAAAGLLVFGMQDRQRSRQ